MATFLKIKKAGVRIDSQQLAAIGEQARCERDRLLKEHPHLQAYQDEIDKMLERAGPAEKRMAVLSLMMEAKLKELGDQLSLLTECLQAVERR